MKQLNATLARGWTRVSTRFLPFADAASPDLPLPRLLRLSLFQVSVGMCAVLLVGTLNRVMIVELGVAAGLVATMVALPLVFGTGLVWAATMASLPAGFFAAAMVGAILGTVLSKRQRADQRA